MQFIILSRNQDPRAYSFPKITPLICGLLRLQKKVAVKNIMTFHVILKLGLWAAGGLLFLVAAAVAALLIYVSHAKRFYALLPDTHDLKAQINKMGADYLTLRPNGALAIALYQSGKECFQGFGRISDSNTNPPDARTIFEIGSITKVFTATLLAKMVQDGMVKLADPISPYLPKTVVVPTKNGREITLENLAAHTAGLPRLPDNFLAAANPQNPYANYTTKHLYESLATLQLNSEPGKKSAYSNYGFGLLGKLLEAKAGKSFETLIQEIVCEPRLAKVRQSQPRKNGFHIFTTAGRNTEISFQKI
jgi:CubicO group peptidase (beta-lactamase class C family)